MKLRTFTFNFKLQLPYFSFKKGSAARIVEAQCYHCGRTFRIARSQYRVANYCSSC